MTNEKNYKYAGNTECGCCSDECTVISINRENFKSLCRTTEAEWINTVSTDARGNEAHYCDLWFKNRGELYLYCDETKYTDGNVAFYGFGSEFYDYKIIDPYAPSNRTYEEGDKYVVTSTFTLGNHSVSFVTTSTYFNIREQGIRPDRFERNKIFIDGELCYVSDYRGWHSTSIEGDGEFDSTNLVRKDGKVYVFSGLRGGFIGEFDDVPNEYFHFHQTFEFIGGSDKYIHVDPNATWRKTYNCISYESARCHPGYLSESDKRELEDIRRYEDEHKECCVYPKLLLTTFSPQIKLRVENAPDYYADMPHEFRPITFNYPNSSFFVNSHELNFDWQTLPYCENSNGEACRIELGGWSGNIIGEICDGYMCREVPYGATMEFTEYEDVCRGVELTVAPQYGTARVIHNTDGYESWTLQYTAPTSLPSGVCVDTLQYRRAGVYGEQQCGIKFKLYKDSETYYEPLDGYGLDVGNEISICACKRVLAVSLSGVAIESYDNRLYTTQRTYWSIELFGIVSAGPLTYEKLIGTEFKYIEGASRWSYKDGCDSSGTGYTDYSLDNEQWRSAKNKMSRIKAVFETAPKKGYEFIHSTNNIIDLCSVQDIRQIEVSVGGRLVKRKVSITSTGFDTLSTSEVIDSETIPTNTFIIDGGESPTETPYGLITLGTTGDISVSFDTSEYAERFHTSSINCTLQLGLGQKKLCDNTGRPLSDTVFIWKDNERTTTDENNNSVYTFDEIVFEITTKQVNVRYF